MVFDEARGVTVLVTLGETWTWDGHDWLLVANSGPAPRWGHTLSYDPLRARVVLFGGRDASSDFGDTWEWDGSSWTLVSSGGPTARHGHVAAFNLTTSTTTLYGGASASSGALGDTWDWNGSTWTLRSLNSPFGARSFSAFARRQASGSLLLYGGDLELLSDRQGDSWRITSGGWTVVDACGIPSREQSCMVYDTARACAVLFGGLGQDDELKAETWEYRGAWSRIPIDGPSGRRSPAMAYDTLRQRTVLFGGVTDTGPSRETWELSAVGVPTVPMDVQAGEVRRGVALVSWTPDPLSTSNTPIERERWNGSSWVEPTTVGIVAPGPTRWLDLPGAGAFRYRVRATSCIGVSSWSSDVIVTPLDPGTPGGGLARRGVVTVTWSDRSDFESSFQVERERSIGGRSGPWINATVVANLPADTTVHSERPGLGIWRYRVRASNVGGSSAWSGWWVVTVN